MTACPKYGSHHWRLPDATGTVPEALRQPYVTTIVTPMWYTGCLKPDGVAVCECGEKQYMSGGMPGYSYNEGVK